MAGLNLHILFLSPKHACIMLFEEDLKKKVLTRRKRRWDDFSSLARKADKALCMLKHIQIRGGQDVLNTLVLFFEFCNCISK